MKNFFIISSIVLLGSICGATQHDIFIDLPDDHDFGVMISVDEARPFIEAVCAEKYNGYIKAGSTDVGARSKSRFKDDFVILATCIEKQ